jgi:hypothetical protein
MALAPIDQHTPFDQLLTSGLDTARDVRCDLVVLGHEVLQFCFCH